MISLYNFILHDVKLIQAFFVQFQPGGGHNENPGPLHSLLAGCVAGELFH